MIRTDPDIWYDFHWFTVYMRQTRPLEAGVYDLSRYKKLAAPMSDEQG